MASMENKPHGVVFHVVGKNHKQSKRRNANMKRNRKMRKAAEREAIANGTPLPERKQSVKLEEKLEMPASDDNEAVAEPQTPTQAQLTEDEKRRLKARDRKQKQKAKKRGVDETDDTEKTTDVAKTEVIAEVAAKKVKTDIPAIEVGKRDKWQKGGVVSDRALYNIAEFEQIKAKTAELVAANEISASEAKTMLIKWKNRESRRLARIQHKEDSRVCFNCRGSGHLVADCPKGQSNDGDELVSKVGAGICFKCGSIEHTVKQCHVKVKGYPYAHCFLCKEVGHLSKECSKNERGIYPDGGACNMCGQNDHLRRDCPKLMPDETLAAAAKLRHAERNRIRTAGTVDVMGNVEDDTVDNDRTKVVVNKRQTKKAKVVKMM